MSQQANAFAEQPSLPWLSLPESGWDHFIIKPPEKAFLDTFDDLVFDQYAAHAQRYRRFSQYRVAYKGGFWELNVLPHRPFIQSANHNPLVGGILREFAPLRPACDITPYINEMFSSFLVDRSGDYHLDVHQYRVNAKPASNGLSVPEGPHRDGQECVAILVFRRHRISGAEFSLIEPVTNKTFFSSVIGENEGVILDDDKMLHDASPVVATSREKGYRDYIVININAWQNRRYGPEFEARARQ